MKIGLKLVIASIVLGIFSGAFASGSSQSTATEPTFSVKLGDQNVTLTRTELLSRKDLEKVTVVDDPAYPSQKAMTYTAVPVQPLLKLVKIPDEGVILFQALDGYSSALPKRHLMNISEEKPIPYLAIEEPGKQWPALNPQAGSQTAGPFYLIWKQKAGTPISPEEWPYQLSGFDIKASLKEAFPKIFPDARFSEKSTVFRGMKVFTKNCFSCHTMNGQGESTYGPDLNLPMNPTEYFKSDAVFKKFIRDPQTVRSWSKGKMKPVDEAHVSNRDLDDLISYLKHMVKRKQ